MRSLVQLIGRIFQRSPTETDAVDSAARTVGTAPSPHSSASFPVEFVAFEQSASGIQLRCRDDAGRVALTSPLERMAPLGNGWYVAHTLSGNRYQIYLAPEQFAVFQRMLQTPTSTAAAAPVSQAPPVVLSRGFFRTQQGVHFRLTDAYSRELVSSPVLRLDPLGDGWYLVHTRSGSLYRSQLSAADLQELQPQARPAQPAATARPVATAQPAQRTPVQTPAPGVFQPKTHWPTVAALSWAGAEMLLQVQSWTLPTPLTYWSEGRLREDEASCIDRSLPVGQPVREQVGALGYWPRYSCLSPQQRGNYLAWLASGRQTVIADVGYAFIFFYGLERRVLVDRQDLYPALCEVARLLEQYPGSASFQSYGRRFVAYALAQAGLDQLSDTWCSFLVEKAGLLRHPEGLAAALAWQHQRELPLPVAWALRVAELDERTGGGVVLERVRPQFEALFAQKFATRFPEGFQLRCAKRAETLSYHPGSPSLLQSHLRADVLAPVRIPHVLGIASQFKPVVELWNECLEELRPLARQVGKGVAVSSRAAYDALPPALQAVTEHPDAARWQSVAARHGKGHGVSLAPVAEVAVLVDCTAESKLTGKQSLELAATAEQAGFAIEPDTRSTRRPYSVTDRVALYREERLATVESVEGAYPAAALVLELGIAMAAADGEIEAAEVTHVTQFIEGQFQLTAAQSRRLEALRLLFQAHPPSLGAIGSRLQAILSSEQRETLLTFLIGVAAANGTIDRAETALLRKAARALGADAARLEGLLRELLWNSDGSGTDEPVVIQQGTSGRAGEAIPTRAPSKAPEVAEVVLNEELLRSIMRDTEHVAQMLTAAMAEFEGDQEEVLGPDVSPEPSPEPVSGPQKATQTAEVNESHFDLAGLEVRYHGLVTALLAAEEWTPQEFEGLVRSHGLFPAGTLDVVNEWAEEYLGDLLIEEGDLVRIQIELVKERV